MISVHLRNNRINVNRSNLLYIMQKKISIVIVTYNSDNHISDCLESIFKYNDIGDALEIIIVDNMSKNTD